MQRRPWVGAAAIDVAAVLVFVAAGRTSHDDGSSVVDLLGVAAPFLLGLAAGWLLTPGARADPLALRTGAGAWIGTTVIGLLLRRVAWDQGTAVSFVIVTVAILGLLLIGWRAMWGLGSSRRAVRSAPPPSEAGR